MSEQPKQKMELNEKLELTAVLLAKKGHLTDARIVREGARALSDLWMDKAELIEALSRCRGQWIHSVNAENNLRVLAKHTKGS